MSCFINFVMFCFIRPVLIHLVYHTRGENTNHHNTVHLLIAIGSLHTSIASPSVSNGRKVWRYQRGNHNPYIEEQTTQWPKEKVQKDKQRSTKHTYIAKDRVTRTPSNPEARTFHFSYFFIKLATKATKAQIPDMKYISIDVMLNSKCIRWTVIVTKLKESRP